MRGAAALLLVAATVAGCAPRRVQEDNAEAVTAARFPVFTRAEVETVERALLRHGNLGVHGNFASPLATLLERHRVTLQREGEGRVQVNVTPEAGGWEFYATVELATEGLLHPTVATEAPPPPPGD